MKLEIFGFCQSGSCDHLGDDGRDEEKIGGGEAVRHLWLFKAVRELRMKVRRPFRERVVSVSSVYTKKARMRGPF